MLRRWLGRVIRQARRRGVRSLGARLVAELRAVREVRRWRAAGRAAPALAPWNGPATMRPPIFVGGTGRSGTTITGQLLGAHPDYALVRHEVHFLTDAGGLTDLASGRTTIGRFERRFASRWFVRPTGTGIHRFAERTLIAQALRELRETFDADGDLAVRRFVHRLFDPIAQQAGAEGWVEMTPNNALVGDVLLRVFPDARLLHTVRDGRDVATSVVPQSWGPGNALAGMEWWGRRLVRAFEATAGLPPDRLKVVQMEALTIRDRDAEFARLLEWAGLEDHPDIRRFFDDVVTAERSHGGRWRVDVPPGQIEAFLAAYETIVDDIRRRGWPYDPGVPDANGRVPVEPEPPVEPAALPG